MRRFGKGDEVLIVGVYATRAEEAHQMQPPTMRQLQRALKLWSLGEATVGECCVDPWQLLRHALPSANVEMPNLTIAHLTFREANGYTARLKRCVWPTLEQCAPNWHLRLRDRVHRWIVADPKAINDQQDERIYLQ